MTPSSVTRHQLIAFRLSHVFMAYFETHPIGTGLAAPCDVVLSEIDIVQPDLFVVLMVGWLKSPTRIISKVLLISWLKSFPQEPRPAIENSSGSVRSILASANIDSSIPMRMQSKFLRCKVAASVLGVT